MTAFIVGFGSFGALITYYVVLDIRETRRFKKALKNLEEMNR